MTKNALLAAFAIGSLLALASPAAGQGAAPSQQDHAGMDMSGDMQGMDMSSGPMKMDMGGMQAGKAPADARNSDDYSDGYRNSALPNYEMADQIKVPKLLAEELEFTSGNEGKGMGWSLLLTNGTDDNKLWVRTQGLKNSREDRLDPESSAEALWWHARGPYWGTLLGVRQDIGRGATTWLAAGVEGLAPYWFDIQLTGYLGTDGRLAARAKVSYDMLLSNRLILTPQAEANIYSKQSRDRELGAGLSNVELSARMRYEISRKFAPYLGYVWERSFDGTADFRRIRGERPGEHRFLAGLRLWW